MSIALGKTMTGLGGAKPHVVCCPACRQAVYRLTLRGRWARWRAWLTGRRPYACAHCGWQGRLAVAAAQADVIDQLPWFRSREPRRKDKGE
ncbi:MAG: hypothetical protein HYR56_22525 [Acidobacteria bacterium]|nr:hypothetical protein [Acidobacteriota bacterium]MBI3424463.1 hypothetical protein [Acidobacteriota bacterium]